MIGTFFYNCMYFILYINLNKEDDSQIGFSSTILEATLKLVENNTCTIKSTLSTKSRQFQVEMTQFS